MAKIIMAIGRGRGPWYDPAKPEKREPEYYEITAADQVGEFTYEEALVWAAAHDEPQAHARHQFNRAMLEKVARESYQISYPAPAVDHLLSEGVLTEANLEDGPHDDFFKRYRLMPNGVCAGNLPDQRDMHTLVVGEGRTVVSRLALGIWTYSYLDGSVWDGCKSYAKVYRKQGQNVPAEAFATEIAFYLPAIIAVGAGVLEPM